LEGLEVTPDFWLGKRVFITGHTGFKGAWLSLWLQQLGAEVTGFALPSPTNPSVFNLTNAKTGMTSITGDVRNLVALSNALAESLAEVVIHMAAQPLVLESYKNPVETYSTNVMGTVNLLEAVRDCPTVRAFVNVTTDKCYENKEWLWSYRENETLGGYDPYSSSKACSELITSSYRNSFFNSNEFPKHLVALASARAGNVIGGGDWSKDRLIPDIIAALSNGQPAIIRNPQAIRPWQHVLEPLNGYLTLAEKLFSSGTTYAEAWNFGPSLEDAKPVSWIAEKITSIWRNGASWISQNLDQPHEASCLTLDTSKAKARLFWRPHLNLEQALNLVVHWHKSLLNENNMREVTLTQIKNYQTLISCKKE
jgi:CDP-glucose 4,6-dehydratase